MDCSHTRRAADAGAAGPAGRGAGIHAAAGDGRHGEPQLLGPLQEQPLRRAAAVLRRDEQDEGIILVEKQALGYDSA